MKAIFDASGKYRYYLMREWAHGEGTCLFIMLNPSTADAEKDDPTIRKCIGFAKEWGFQKLEVVNLFAYRATDPKELATVRDPVGLGNDSYLVSCSRNAQMVICAWGTKGAILGRDMIVASALMDRHIDLHFIRQTKAGHPGHPLYLPYGLKPQPWYISG